MSVLVDDLLIDEVCGMDQDERTEYEEHTLWHMVTPYDLKSGSP